MTDYDFRSLSSGDFEQLACDVLNADQGLALHGFPAGPDGGVDLREVAAGGFTTVAQCKHYRDSSTSKFLSAVAKESNKLAIRQADRYILVTSHPLTPGLEQQVATMLGIGVHDVWGPGRINRVLRDHPEIEQRHFKLWLHSAAVLERIFQAGLWRRTDALLTEMAYRARYWVDVPAYTRASGLLDREGVCILAGGPGVGKSFLAERLMLQALHEGWEVVDATDDIKAAWAAAGGEGRRLFYLDDFLGETELRHDAAQDARSLLEFIAYVGQRKERLRLVMTTREQVLTRAAHCASDRLSDLAGQPARCTLSVSELDEATRVEILLSHVYQSDLPDQERSRLADDNRLRSLAVHPSFSPRLIRGVLTDRRLSGGTAEGVLRLLTAVFADPETLWRTSFEALDEPAQRILLILMTFPARPLPYRDLRYVAAPDLSALAWRRSFRMLEPAWVRVAGPPERRSVAFAGPGCREFLFGLLERDEGALARELVATGLAQIEQLISLSQAAGLLTADGVVPLVAPPARPVLFNTLVELRASLATRVEQLWRAASVCADGDLDPRLLRLRDAAALTVCYGREGGSAWLLREIEAVLDEQVGVLPCIPALAVTRHLPRLSTGPGSDGDEIARRLVGAAIAGADSLQDLDAYEDLPGTIKTEATELIARQRAALIIGDELDRLAHETPGAAELQASVHDLRTRAAWYSADFDFDPLLDLIEELRE